jgi:ATP-binding cassette subfamily B protein AbcA/BmrA
MNQDHEVAKKDQDTVKDKEQYKGNWKQFFKLIRETRPSKLILGFAISFSVISTLVGLVIPMFTKNLVNSFSLSSISTGQIVLMAVTFILQAIMSGVSIYMMNYVGQKVVASLRERLWSKFLVLPIPYYDNHLTGETVSRMTNDTGVVKGLITEHLTSFFTGLISIIGAISILLYLDWQMTLVMLIAIPLLMLFLVPMGKKMHTISKGMQDETASFTAVLSQVLSEIRLVKASNGEEKEYASGMKGITNLFKFGLKEAKIQALLAPLMFFVLMVMLVVIIGYGGLRVSSGALTAGDLVAFILYLFQIIFPVTQIAQFFTQLQKAMGATDRIISTLEMEEENHVSGRVLEQASQPMSIEHLSFGYEPDKKILHDLNFTVHPGTITAIVGPSGSGKSTLFSLIERYYHPSEGAIKLGTDPIDEFTLKSWRSQIGYVSQESPLIAGTIRDNICYGISRTVTEEELRHAAEMAYADEFIQGFPEQYMTEVGERGIKLSGGQRQRIGIARALLRNPKLLMLDEATSSLDSASEVAVQKALNNLMVGRTTLVIAHRLSTVVDADQIIFVDKGTITGRGTHEELYETHTMYREFAIQQLRMYDSNAILSTVES